MLNKEIDKAIKNNKTKKIIKLKAELKFLKRHFPTFSINKTLKKKSKNMTRIVCIGDSITYGFGLTDGDTFSYPSQLQGYINNAN